MPYWLITNFCFALLLPLVVVFMIAFVARGLNVRLLQIIRDFQVGLYCATLVGVTLYDVKVTYDYAKKNKIYELLDNIFYANIWLFFALFFSLAFYGVSVYLSYQPIDEKKKSDENKRILIVSWISVAVTVFAVIIVRKGMGLM